MLVVVLKLVESFAEMEANLNNLNSKSFAMLPTVLADSEDASSVASPRTRKLETLAAT